MLVVLALLAERAQDLAATLALADQQGDVLGERAVGRHAVGELARGHRDRRERTAELVRGGGREPPSAEQLLLAGERHLGRRERIRQAARLVGDPPGVGRDQRCPARARATGPRRRAAAARSCPGATADRSGPGRARSPRRPRTGTARSWCAATGGRRQGHGTISRTENGFCRPPVSPRRKASCRMS